MNLNNISNLDFVTFSGWKDMVDEWVSATTTIAGKNLFTNILLYLEMDLLLLSYL